MQWTLIRRLSWIGRCASPLHYLLCCVSRTTTAQQGRNGFHQQLPFVNCLRFTAMHWAKAEQCFVQATECLNDCITLHWKFLQCNALGVMHRTKTHWIAILWLFRTCMHDNSVKWSSQFYFSTVWNVNHRKEAALKCDSKDSLLVFLSWCNLQFGNYKQVAAYKWCRSHTIAGRAQVALKKLLLNICCCCLLHSAFQRGKQRESEATLVNNSTVHRATLVKA